MLPACSSLPCLMHGLPQHTWASYNSTIRWIDLYHHLPHRRAHTVVPMPFASTASIQAYVWLPSQRTARPPLFPLGRRRTSSTSTGGSAKHCPLTSPFRSSSSACARTAPPRPAVACSLHTATPVRGCRARPSRSTNAASTGAHALRSAAGSSRHSPSRDPPRIVTPRKSAVDAAVAW